MRAACHDEDERAIVGAVKAPPAGVVRRLSAFRSVQLCDSVGNGAHVSFPACQAS